MEEFNLTHSSLSFKNLFFVKKKKINVSKKKKWGFFSFWFRKSFFFLLFSLLTPKMEECYFATAAHFFPLWIRTYVHYMEQISMSN